MELFSTEFFAALGAIILIDLVLAGDNAIVIALAARSLPKHLQKRAILWGTVGAIAVRSLMTMAVVWLLKIPGLLAVGGLLLVWIAIKLIAPGGGGDSGHAASTTSFWAAMKTIIIADAVMGLDNVLAVAGAAHGSFLLVVMGLLISIPVVVWGSTLVLRWVERFPAIVYAGSAVLAWTSAKMMLSEPLLKPWTDLLAGYSWLVYAGLISGVMLAGWWLSSARRGVAVAPRVTATANAANSAKDLGEGRDPAEGGRHILIPVDGSIASRFAVEHVGRSFSSSPDVTVHLLHVLPRFSRHLGRFLGTSVREKYVAGRVGNAIHDAKRRLEMLGLSVRSSVHSSQDVPREIIRVARSIGAEKIVMGSKRTNDLLRFLAGSITGRVLDASPVPVEVVLRGSASPWARIAIPAGVAAALVAAVLD